MFTQLHHHIQKTCSLSNEELALLDTLLEVKNIPKKTVLLHEGEVCNFEAYINKGCIRTYYIDHNGFEVTLQFAVEDWWVSDIASFHDRTPSNVFIETLEDCELLMLSPATKEKVLSQVPRLERFFRILVQRNLSALQNRLFKTIATSAQEKYLDFMERYPSIHQRVAQHYIASYLGISPEFLSKVRAKISKK